MNIDCISKIAGIIAGIGTFIAALIAWWTLKEIKRQRTAAQKPQLLFDSLSVGKINIEDINDRVPIDWKGKNEKLERHILFEFINGGKDIAKNIVFEYKTDIKLFIQNIKDMDSDNEFEFLFEESDRELTISSKTNVLHKFLSLKVNQGESDSLEYLLPRTIQEKPTSFSIPTEYLVLTSCYFYLSKKHSFYINPKNIPYLFLKTKYEDISGNIETIYHKIETSHFKEGTFYFFLKKISKKIYKA